MPSELLWATRGQGGGSICKAKYKPNGLTGVKRPSPKMSQGEAMPFLAKTVPWNQMEGIGPPAKLLGPCTEHGVHTHLWEFHQKRHPNNTVKFTWKRSDNT